VVQNVAHISSRLNGKKVWPVVAEGAHELLAVLGLELVVTVGRACACTPAARTAVAATGTCPSDVAEYVLPEYKRKLGDRYDEFEADTASSSCAPSATTGHTFSRSSGC